MSKFEHRWHVAINKFHDGKAVSEDWQHWMYEAKDMFGEIPRLTRLFKKERLGELSKVFKYCSFSPEEKLTENFLSCCMGQRCSECPYLQAIEAGDLSPEEKDTAKAYTCVAHILSQPHMSIDTSEGYLLTEDDKLFWQRTYALMSEPAEFKE